jgi:hypothetical protein
VAGQRGHLGADIGASGTVQVEIAVENSSNVVARLDLWSPFDHVRHDESVLHFAQEDAFVGLREILWMGKVDNIYHFLTA